MYLYTDIFSICICQTLKISSKCLSIAIGPFCGRSRTRRVAIRGASARRYFLMPGARCAPRVSVPPTLTKVPAYAPYTTETNSFLLKPWDPLLDGHALFKLISALEGSASAPGLRHANDVTTHGAVAIITGCPARSQSVQQTKLERARLALGQ